MSMFVVFMLPQRAQSAEYQKEITSGQGFNSCDTYAMAAAIDNTIIIESDEVSQLLLWVEIKEWDTLLRSSPLPGPGGSVGGAAGHMHPRNDGAWLHGMFKEEPQGCHHEKSWPGEIQSNAH